MGSAAGSDAVRSTYVQVSAPSPLLPQNDALVWRAPKRDDLDQPNALNLANVGGCNYAILMHMPVLVS